MSTISQSKIQEAYKELQQKSHSSIEAETAIKWGARAIASFELAIQSLEESRFKALRFLLDAEDYAREALEHAAMVTEHSHLASDIAYDMERARKEALSRIVGSM